MVCNTWWILLGKPGARSTCIIDGHCLGYCKYSRTEIWFEPVSDAKLLVDQMIHMVDENRDGQVTLLLTTFRNPVQAGSWCGSFAMLNNIRDLSNVGGFYICEPKVVFMSIKSERAEPSTQWESLYKMSAQEMVGEEVQGEPLRQNPFGVNWMYIFNAECTFSHSKLQPFQTSESQTIVTLGGGCIRCSLWFLWRVQSKRYAEHEGTDTLIPLTPLQSSICQVIISLLSHCPEQIDHHWNRFYQL
jgi:hypothetical protein